MNRRRLWEVCADLAALLACIAACSPWLRGFDQSALLPHLVGATVIAFALPLVFVYVFARRTAWSAAASVVAFFVYTTFGVLGSASEIDLVFRGLTRGPARLLSATLPFSEPEWLLVVPVAACWITGALVGESLARGKGVGFPVVVWVVSFAVAYAATTGGTTDATGAALALLATAGMFALTRRWAIDSQVSTDADVRLPKTRLALGASVLIICALAAVATPSLAVFEAEPKQADRDPELRTPVPVTPIVAVAQMRARAAESGPEPVFSVETDGDTPGYVAIAELDSYDGDVWRFFRTFEPTGGRVPELTSGSGDEVTQQYAITDLDDTPWMPYMPAARRVDGVSVGYDEATGMIVPESPLDAGTSYKVTSLLLAEPLDAVEIGAQPALGGSSSNARDSLTPVNGSTELRDAVDALAEDLGRDPARDPIGFLQALEQHLRSYALAPAQPEGAGAIGAGTSLAEVLSTVIIERDGTPEQFATAYALLARQVGVPARIVAGFRLSEGAAALPAGEYDVTTDHAWTWVEIATRDGWRVADPTPGSEQVAPPTTAGAAAAVTTTTVVEATIDEDTPAIPVAQAEASTRPQSGSPISGLLFAAGGAVLAIAVALPLLYRARRVSRRRSRQRGNPAQRVIGAWHEALETMAEAAVGGLAPLTADEVSETARVRFSPRAAMYLATVGDHANLALFAPTAVLDDAHASEAWRAMQAFRRSVREATPFRQRLGGFFRFRTPLSPPTAPSVARSSASAPPVATHRSHRPWIRRRRPDR